MNNCVNRLISNIYSITKMITPATDTGLVPDWLTDMSCCNSLSTVPLLVEAC